MVAGGGMNENENAVGEFIVTPLARSLAFGTAMQTVLARSYCMVPRWAGAVPLSALRLDAGR